MGNLPFFCTDTGEDLVSECIILALKFKCAPMDFFDLSISEVRKIMWAVVEVAEQLR